VAGDTISKIAKPTVSITLQVPMVYSVSVVVRRLETELAHTDGRRIPTDAVQDAVLHTAREAARPTVSTIPRMTVVSNVAPVSTFTTACDTDRM
jgi:hypothetical protein